MSRRPWAVARLAAPLALTLTLVACSSVEDPPAPEAERSSSTASENTDPGVVTEDGGSTATTYQGVPPDYPLDEVPLLDEDAVVSSNVTEIKKRTSFSVIVASDLPPAEAQAAAVEQLDGTDLELLGPLPSTEDEPATYSGDDGLFVVLLVSPSDEGSELVYNVEVP